MNAEQRLRSLGFWSGSVTPAPLGGGITNANFVVTDHGEKYFVRIGDDILPHGVLRFNELAASRAAYQAGLSPEVVYTEPGAIVLRFIEGRTLAPADVREPANLQRIVSLMQICHRQIPIHLRGPALAFWVFQVLRNYAHLLRDGRHRLASELPRWLGIAARLERAVGAIELVFGHNDLLAANFIDDGSRLWLIDWDYAGFNSPLFDLGGLASNNELDTAACDWLLEAYFERPVDLPLRRRFAAMRCASLLRESMWSMVSETHSHIDFDFRAYTDENLQRFEQAWAEFDEPGVGYN